MFPTLNPTPRPVRLGITSVIPVGTSDPARITITLDPPNDRFEVVWYQDTMTDVFTPEEAIQAISDMVHEALRTLATGRLFTPDHPEAPPALDGQHSASERRLGEIPGQLTL